MRHNNLRRRGLILLIVLSMLTLFSLLAISYVVFSGQSRSANFGMARRDFHGMKGGEVIDEAMKQILRGTTGNISAVGPHDLLGDLYGYSESSRSNQLNLQFRVRVPNPLPASNRPQDYQILFGGSGVVKRFLRIPLDMSVSNMAAPADHDAFTGRVLTFLQGPLSGISFRIVRSVADIPAPDDILRHSVVIDLDEAGAPGLGITEAGAPQLLYDANNRGYQMWINARELNGLGYGIPYNFDGETLATTSTSFTPGGNIPFNLQPGLHPDKTFGGQIGAANADQLSVGKSNPSDSDEAYDAPDQNDFFLAHTRLPFTIPDPTNAGADGLPGQNIIPSFHRAALVNYIINREDLTDSAFKPEKFVNMLNDIQGACGRPLGISVVNIGEAPYSYISANPYFDGSNLGAAGIPPAPNITPVLTLDLQGRWDNWNKGTPSPYEKFLAWARWLTGGPWDVDNDGDGINDSVWVDLDLPLITSAEGKLLKMMTAYYIEDLDNRLDLNAVGNLAQSTDVDFRANPANNPLISQNYALANPNTDLPQGFGLGPAESSLRHLFAIGPTGDTEWRNFLQSRYGGSGRLPGSGVSATNPPTPTFDDLRSRLDGGSQLSFDVPGNPLQNTGTRSRRQRVRHDQLPGLPSAPRGEFAMGFDRLGNPLMLRGTLPVPYDQGTDDPYESRLMSTPHQDSPFTIAEWERVYRHRDWDRSAYPNRLASFAFDSNINAIRAVTPRTSHTRHVPLAATSAKPPTDPQITSFQQLLTAIGQFRKNPIPIVAASYAELFPMEFKRALAMDLNRPFGNGVDDNGDGSIDEPNEMLNGSLFSSGNALNFITMGLQKSAYINGDQVQLTGTNELPALDPTSGSPARFGYTYGNVDPDYEWIVNSGVGGNLADQELARRYHGRQSRQLMARHLYCLAWLLLPDRLYLSSVPSGTALIDDDRARAIAQWAVNVIDFRDADHVMTRFAYDPNPFTLKPTGSYWVPPRIPDPIDPINNPPIPQGYVVWGMEQPELLLTETGATHDLRIKDTAEDSTGKTTTDMPPDDDYDQYRTPQGSLFLEFICPRTTSTSDSSFVPGTANSLYFDRGGNRFLNLSAATPSDGTTKYPVWRVAISEPHVAADRKPTPNESFKLPNSRHAVTYQLYVDKVIDVDGGSDVDNEAKKNGLAYAIGGSQPTPSIDRLVWFTNQRDPMDDSYISNVPAAAVGLSKTVSGVKQSVPLNERDAHVYFNSDDTRNAKVLLAGGQYLVVGPREKTYFGSKIPTVAGPLPIHEPSDHRIEFQPGWANIYTSASPTTPVLHPPAQNIVQMTAVTTPPWNRARDGTIDKDKAFPWVGLNVSEPHPTDTGYYPEPDQHLNSDDTSPPNPVKGFGDLPFDAYYDYKDGANTKPWNSPFDATLGPIHEYYELVHPPTSPAAKVATPGTQPDWCTAFLQRLADPERPYHVTFNPYITVDWMPIDLTVFSGEDVVKDASGSEFPATYQFEFRSKNGAIGGAAGQTFLSYASEEPSSRPDAPGTTAYFKKELPAESTTSRPPPPPALEPNLTTLGYLNSAFAMPSVPIPAYMGAPSTPPANLQWYNRDFASPYELMLVPLSAPGQLMQEFSIPTAPVNLYSDFRLPNTFGHLPNFFQQADNTTNTNALPRSFTAATLLELVTVPSPWSDAAKVIPPASFDLTNLREVIVLGPLMPPYNRISQMREPGRVNINTLEDVEVMRGLEWSYLDNANRVPGGSSRAYLDLKESRDKYYSVPIGTEQITGNKRNTNLNGNYPTEFPGVFKSSLAAGRVAPTAGALDSLAIQSPANATIFRVNPATSATLITPRPELKLTNTLVPNPQTEYLPFSRLANLTTTRSNVFAVRITVGYFEYDPSTGVGPEYGWDNGQSRRHRGFYVIDRSIPVAYEPGQDLNTGNCVLVRRIVE
ncbi:MAG: hypothetical protein IT422_13575 [Pirellulaceae bacterium]|nr:hypothetical protein [Pirellulaceae bacterium]